MNEEHTALVADLEEAAANSGMMDAGYWYGACTKAIAAIRALAGELDQARKAYQTILADRLTVKEQTLMQDAEEAADQMIALEAERDTLRAELEAANKGYDAAHDECVALRAEVERLTGDLQLTKLSRDAKLCSECPRISEWEALKRDAERYRWLRDQAEDYDGHACFPDVQYPCPIPDSSPFNAIDAAIDAALADKPLSGPTP